MLCSWEMSEWLFSHCWDQITDAQREREKVSFNLWFAEISVRNRLAVRQGGTWRGATIVHVGRKQKKQWDRQTERERDSESEYCMQTTCSRVGVTLNHHCSIGPWMIYKLCLQPLTKIFPLPQWLPEAFKGDIQTPITAGKWQNVKSRTFVIYVKDNKKGFLLFYF